jgi:hypothetical protein
MGSEEKHGSEKQSKFLKSINYNSRTQQNGQSQFSRTKSLGEPKANPFNSLTVFTQPITVVQGILRAWCEFPRFVLGDPESHIGIGFSCAAIRDRRFSDCKSLLADQDTAKSEAFGAHERGHNGFAAFKV